MHALQYPPTPLHTCMHTYIHKRKHAYIHVYTYIRTHVHTYMHAYTKAYLHTDTESGSLNADSVKVNNQHEQHNLEHSNIVTLTMHTMNDSFPAWQRYTAKVKSGAPNLEQS